MPSHSNLGANNHHRSLAPFSFRELSFVVLVTRMFKRRRDVSRQKAEKEREEKFREYYDEFWSKDNVKAELEAYAKADDAFEYKTLQGFVPKSLVGKVTTGHGPPWKPSDTFFTDFKFHYDQERVLHATEKSLIICNHACHDVRLYDADVDPSGSDKKPAAGMSYMHLLVIPVARVYNAVALEDSECIEEMISHFKAFWGDAGSKDKIINAINGAMTRRYEEILKAYKAQASADASNTTEGQTTTLEKRENHLKDVMSNCSNYASHCADLLKEMNEDFTDYFGFHAHPTTSVGHLHMHVLLMKNEEFRKHSTKEHDWKTIPADVVVNVINAKKKKASSSEPDTKSCSSFFHRFIAPRSSRVPAG